MSTVVYRILSIDPSNLGALSAFIQVLRDSDKRKRAGAVKKLSTVARLLHPEYPWSDLHYVGMATSPTGANPLIFCFQQKIDELPEVLMLRKELLDEHTRVLREADRASRLQYPDTTGS